VRAATAGTPQRRLHDIVRLAFAQLTNGFTLRIVCGCWQRRFSMTLIRSARNAGATTFTSARSLLESTCKLILGDLKVSGRRHRVRPGLAVAELVSMRWTLP